MCNGRQFTLIQAGFFGLTSCPATGRQLAGMKNAGGRALRYGRRIQPLFPYRTFEDPGA
ncbi:hypothetical protein C4K27_5485 [Pseudomonas chlororaphis subsp. chlororaphis]|nr:hypothetical protein C4K27_5485 [Pseudomonas chlororaphis subsp. chlororaphis]